MKNRTQSGTRDGLKIKGGDRKRRHRKEVESEPGPRIAPSGAADLEAGSDCAGWPGAGLLALCTGCPGLHMGGPERATTAPAGQAIFTV